MSRFSDELRWVRAAERRETLCSSTATPGKLRGPNWRKVQYGIYVPEDAPPAQCTAQRIVDVAPLLTEHSAIAGWAAAYASGADWLDGVDVSTGALLPVDILTRAKRPSTAIARYHYDRSVAAVSSQAELPVTPPTTTAIDGARWAASTEDALVFLDAMLRFRLVTVDEIAATLAEMHSSYGLPQARIAASLMRTGVWSPRESRLRYIYQVRAGLPAPLVNVRVFDTDGQLIGHPDLFDPEAALAVEFDGDQHRSRAQHHTDNIREEQFESIGVTVVRSDGIDLRPAQRPRLVRCHRQLDRASCCSAGPITATCPVKFDGPTWAYFLGLTSRCP